ncbi:MAG: DUF4159 domain-containing protein [Phycisphaerales bacterium]|nr:DUF4159 domain-containing protein [Phycisphaerales bacterium]
MKTRHHHWWTAATILMLLWPIAMARAADSAAGQVSSKQVIAAIDKAVDYLLKQDLPQKHWERGVLGPWQEKMPQFLGESALVTEALLDVQQSLHLQKLDIFSGKMKSAIEFLLNNHNNTTYSTSFQANAIALLPKKPQYRATMAWDYDYLLHSLHYNGAYSYGWGTPFTTKTMPLKSNFWDNSNSQYGILGMWAVADYGIGVPQLYWQLTADHWRKTQHANGSWWYDLANNGDGNTPDVQEGIFTPAGVASLLIADEFLARRHTNKPLVDPNVERALAWMNAHFDPKMKNQYEMYGYERVGLASGLQRFGGHNWYKAFAATLVHLQHPDGSWSPHFLSAGGDPVGTAYALLILVRGLNPVFINKLQYNKAYFGRWNARQRDVANMVEWVSKQTETPLNWQVANINAPLSDWLNSPILYITGNNDPKFTKVQIQKLRRYVNAGGLVLCSPNEDSMQFRGAMIRYGREVVRNGYEYKTLTIKSDLYHMQPWFHFYVPMLGLSNGARYVWLICPNDLGSIWQRNALNQTSYWHLPLNLYLYATGKGSLGNRLQTLEVPEATGAPARSISIGQLSYAGNWNPEPGAWPRLAKILAADAATKVNLSTVSLDHAAACGLGMLHMTGTDGFHVSPQEVAEIQKYINKGGLLFADGCGGHPEFANGFTQLMMKAFPHEPLQKIPDDAPMITGKVPGGVDASKVTYRRFYVSTKGIRSKPGLLGIKIGRRWGVIFSQTDITSGLLGTHTWGILGYSPKSSVALARNIVEYAALQGK